MQFLAVLRHLEGFLEKSEESRPPLKLKNNGGLLSAIFLQDASFKRYRCQGGLDVIEKFSKNTFWNCHIIWSSKICITPLSYLFFCKPAQGQCAQHCNSRQKFITSPVNRLLSGLLPLISIQKYRVSQTSRHFIIPVNFT